MPTSPSLPTAPLMPGFLVVEASKTVALGTLQVPANLYRILTIWSKTKGALSCHLQSVLAKRLRLPMLLTLNTGAAAGSCSLWVLAPRELGFVLSESSQQRFLLALGYETQLCGIAEQSMGAKPLFKCGVLPPKAGVWEQAINKLTFTLAQRPHETSGRSQVSEQGFPFLRSTGKMTAMRIFWSCRVLQLQRQHKVVKGSNHSQSVKKQDKCRGKTEMYCMASILGYEFTF